MSNLWSKLCITEMLQAMRGWLMTNRNEEVVLRPARVAGVNEQSQVRVGSLHLLESSRDGSRRPAARRSFQALPRENEDTEITGGTRSLERRLLGLNLSGSLKRSAGRVSAQSGPGGLNGAKLA
jgi:hypothetical protein